MEENKYDYMFKYNSGEPKEGQIRISPSGIKDLIKNRPHWIKSNVLNQRKQADMTNANIGTVIHAMIEATYKGIEPMGVLQAGLAYYEFTNMWDVGQMLEIMYESWKREYYPTDSEGGTNELWLEFEPSKEIVISGTSDRIVNNTIIDWKSTGSKLSSIDSYRGQLYMYAWIARKNGYEVDNIQAVGITRPRFSSKTKEWGKSSISVVNEPIDEEYLKILIGKVQHSVKDVLEVIGNKDILDWIGSTDILDPFDRSNI